MTTTYTTHITAVRPGQPAKATSKPARPAKAGPHLSLRQRFNRQRNLLLITRQMQVLLTAGTPIVTTLQGLERQTADPVWRQAMLAVRQQVEEGLTLAAAMAQQPHLFDQIYRSLIESGESTGKLPVMLDRLNRLMQKDLQLRSGILGALLYPALLLTIVTSVLMLTLTLVVPRFAGLFTSLNVPIPPTTQATLFASTLLRSYWWILLPGLLSLAVAAAVWLRTVTGHRMAQSLLLRLPVIGGLARSFATARLIRLLGTLIDSHLPLLDALQLSRQSAGNHRYAALVQRAENAVGRGEAVSSAFADATLIHPSVYEAFRSGESSGRIAPCLITVADFLEEENDTIVRSLTKILEPLILVVLGLMVGLLAVSMFLPLFDLTAMAGEMQ